MYLNMERMSHKVEHRVCCPVKWPKLLCRLTFQAIAFNIHPLLASARSHY